MKEIICAFGILVFGWLMADLILNPDVHDCLRAAEVSICCLLIVKTPALAFQWWLADKPESR